MIDVPSQVLKEVTDVTASTARMDRKVDWMDETLGKIASKKKHLSLLKRSKELEKEFEQRSPKGDHPNFCRN